jgi:hypothetical protein
VTAPLEAKFSAFTDRTAKTALRSATSKAALRGKSLVKAKTPVKTGASRAGIRSMTRSAGATALARIYPSGPHAHVTRWQDQGTGERHKRNGQYTGRVEPQYMFERSQVELEGEVDQIYETAIALALVKAALK